MTEAAESASLPVNRRGRFWHAFKPLVFWAVGSIVLLTWDAYLRTTIQVVATIDMGVLKDLGATVDGEKFRNGQRLRPGRRKIVITAADSEPLETNVFLHLGLNDFGRVQLHRSCGTVEMNVSPPAKEIRITGEFMSNSSQNAQPKFEGVPIGHYQVVALFDHSREERQIDVTRNQTTRVEIKAPVGAIALSSEPSDAEFNLSSRFGQGVSMKGKTPAVLPDIPAGQYQLQVGRAEYQKSVPVDVRQGETNEVAVQFEFGELRVETKPAGAKIVLDRDEVGQTPKTITGLRPGRHIVTLFKDGCDPVQLSIEVKASESKVISTNLVNRMYATSMKEVHQFLESSPPDYGQALGSVGVALIAQPEDKEAIELKKKIIKALQEADDKRKQEKKQ